MAGPRGGMVATSHPVAVRAAVETLRDGGHAVDAAIAAALVPGVVDPMSTSLGGDAFALVWDEPARSVHAINGSGRAPARASARELCARGHATMPELGILAVTVPGALAMFEDLRARFGRRSLAALCAPAIATARDGHEVTPIVARDWAAKEQALRDGHGTRALLVGGERAPRAGETWRNEDLARTLETIARGGVAELYRGELARAIERTSIELDGWLGLEDLGAHRSTWVTPISARYRDVTVWEPPPNGQGLVVLEALRILDAFDLGRMSAAERAHHVLEALKLAFADGLWWITDGEVAPAPIGALLSDDYARSRRALVGARAATSPARGALPGDTVYVTVVDADGNACSLIHSVYMHFGAQIVVPGTGLVLQNRGALFSLDPAHPNALAPGKRPYHTIIPALATRDERLWLSFGVVGGFMQPQAQVQILSNLLDLAMPIDDAVRAPRVRWLDHARIMVEPGSPPDVAPALEALGHELVPPQAFGGAQAILVDADGALHGASDPRKDGCCART